MDEKSFHFRDFAVVTRIQMMAEQLRCSKTPPSEWQECFRCNLLLPFFRATCCLRLAESHGMGDLVGWSG